MIQNAIATDDIGAKVVRGPPVLEVQQPDIDRWVATAEYRNVGGPPIGCDHSAFAGNEKAGQIADSSADLKHSSTCDLKLERSQMLEASLCQRKITVGMEVCFWRHAKPRHPAHNGFQCPLTTLDRARRWRNRPRYSDISHRLQPSPQVKPAILTSLP